MELLCKTCPKKCKEKRSKKSVMKYCSDAPEGKRVFIELRRFQNERNSKKAKSKKKRA